MKAPNVRATIERRVLVNYRVAPDVLASVLPAPFRPTLVGGYGVAGICLIRLGGIRPRGFPEALGLTAENAAHRVGVEWDTPDGPTHGVYIARRDTSSALVALLGGRAFPGWHHRADFIVEEGNGSYRIEVASRDGKVSVAVQAHVADDVMPGSVFARVEEASEFFRGAPVAYAATPRPSRFDGVRLGTGEWGIRPLMLDRVESSFFGALPASAAVPDSAFIMAGLDSTWAPQPRLLAATG